MGRSPHRDRSQFASRRRLDLIASQTRARLLHTVGRGLVAAIAISLLVTPEIAGSNDPRTPIHEPIADPDRSAGPGWTLEEAPGLVVSGTRRGPAQGDVLVNDPSREGEAPGCTVQSEPSVAAFRSNVYVGFNDGNNCVSALTGAPLHFTGFSRSTDGGKHFRDLGPLIPNGPISGLGGDPVLAVDTAGANAGSLYFASLATDTNGASTIAVGVSTDQGKTFRWHSVDPRPPSGSFQDKEWIAIDNSGGPRDGDLYVTWTDFESPQTLLKMAVSRDQGATWSVPQQLASGDVQGSRPAVGPGGEIVVVWEQGFGGPQIKVPPEPSPGISIWWSRSRDGGGTFSHPSKVASGGPTGHSQVCGISAVQNVLNGDIRVNEFPSIAIDTFGSLRRGSRRYNRDRGTVYVAYAARGAATPDESDVFLTRLPRGASRFSKSVRVNDDRTSTDQFFPEVTVAGPGEVAVMWTDRRQDAAAPSPAGNRLMDQWLAVSHDAGRTFAPNVQFSGVRFPPPITNPNSDVAIASCYAGDYNALASVDGQVVAAWADNRDSMEVAGNGFIPDPNVYFGRQRVTAP